MANFFPARAFGRGTMGSPTAKRAGGVVKIFRAGGRARRPSRSPRPAPCPSLRPAPCSLPVPVLDPSLCSTRPDCSTRSRPSPAHAVPCSRRPLRSTFPPVSHFPRPSAGTPARRPCARPLDPSRPSRPSRSTTGRGGGAGQPARTCARPSRGDDSCRWVTIAGDDCGQTGDDCTARGDDCG